MRITTFLLALACFWGAAEAKAAVLWCETTTSTNIGQPVTHWAKGATLEDVMLLAKTYTGTDQIRILASCRENGWFAYVGSKTDTQRGVSCGFANKTAALLKAKQECELEKGHCDLERVGYDDGSASDPRVDYSAIPSLLPAKTGASKSVGSDVGPLYFETPLAERVFGKD